MAEIDISYWKPVKIAEIAKELLKKVSDTSWNWKVEYHPDEDTESRSLSHWTLEGDSKKHKLRVMMYLGNVPWTTRWKLYFTKDGKDYMCLEEEFGKIKELKELEIKLDSIGRETKKKQDAKSQKQSRDESRQYNRELEQEADRLVTSLKGR